MKEPRQSYWKPQHEVFIKGMLLHGDKIKAYKEAYPNASAAVVRQAAYRLLSYPHIRQRIDAVVAEAQAAAIKELEEKTRQRVGRELATAYEQRLFLADIIFGRMKLQRQVKLRNRVVEVEEDLDTNIVLRAIELDCKLEAGFQWPLHQAVIDRQIDRLAYYLNSPNNGQGVAICKSRTCGKTDWGAKPLQESFSYFAKPPFVTENTGKNS